MLVNLSPFDKIIEVSYFFDSIRMVVPKFVLILFLPKNQFMVIELYKDFCQEHLLQL